MSTGFEVGAAQAQVRWLLDSNVVSELCRPQPHPDVLARFAAHRTQVAIAAPVWHELNYGHQLMPDGRRKALLGEFLGYVVQPLPCLSYDAVAAGLHAQWRAAAQRRGRVLPFLDAQIAAIAVAQQVTLVTRNTRDFADIPGLRLANWFEPAG